MNSTLPDAIPEIPVSDLNAALFYHQQNLGFTLDWGGGDFGLAGISTGNCRLFVANQDYRKHHGNVGPLLTWLNLDSKEAVNNLYLSWSSSKAKLLSAPESKPWGLHEFVAADLDGNLFRVFYDFGTAERK
jgi:hypothetical protein